MIRVPCDKIAKFNRLEMFVLRSETIGATRPVGSEIFIKYGEMLESIARHHTGEAPHEWDDVILEDDYLVVRIKVVHGLSFVTPLVRSEQTDVDYSRRMGVIRKFLDSVKTAKL
jgi:hypothetical protein